jgi:hypothetical protein
VSQAPAIAVVGGGTPSDEEMAAITAAVEMAWSDLEADSKLAAAGEPSRWRFSGRWWTKPIPSRRDRPF